MKSALDNRKSLIAFTLVELLVVITIIVVLLALLVPAMDKAMYQAELAVCGANLHGIGSGALTYAAQNKRAYPVRSFQPTTRQPHRIAGRAYDKFPSSYVDERPALKGYIPIKIFLDPLTIKIEIENTEPDTDVYTPYTAWYGWRYPAHKGMNRIGDRFEWRGDRFRILAGDYDEYNYTYPVVVSNHSDREYTMPAYVAQNSGGVSVLASNIYLSRWVGTTVVNAKITRGPLDLNFVFDDASVQRFGDVVVEDKRLTPVPQLADGSKFDAEWQTRLPAE